VSRIDPDTNTVVETIETGYNPRWLAAGGDSVWVGVTELDDPSFEEELCSAAARRRWSQSWIDIVALRRPEVHARASSGLEAFRRCWERLE
jgi:hypothetical protein